MKAYGFIFARGGSKGLPGKNIKPLCGKPLIAHSIEAGLASKCLEKIIVSTDSEEIASAARQYRAEVPFMRPAELAADTSPEWLAWRHAVNYMFDSGDKFDVMVSIPATAPLRLPSDINRCVEVFLGGDCDVVITCAEAHRNPHFNMISLDEKNGAHVAFPLDPPPARRQDVPGYYDVTTVAYVTSPEYVLSHDSIWGGRVKAVAVDKINAVDIDDMTDFEIAEFFMRKRLEANK